MASKDQIAMHTINVADLNWNDIILYFLSGMTVLHNVTLLIA